MTVRGAIERKTSQVAGGWLVVTPKDESATIEVLHNGNVVGRTIADEPRPDVREAGFGDGNCGFTFRMPPDLEAVDPAEIELRLLGTEIYLTGRRTMPGSAEPVRYGEGSVFILGPARSGTSVMFLALRNALGLLGEGESHAPQIFQRILFEFYQYVRQFERRDGVLAQRLRMPDFRAYILVYLRRFYFQQFQNAPFVDKTPGLEALVGAPFLQEAFPGAKFIVMERNGIETIESYRRKFRSSFDDALKAWSGCSRQTAKLKETMPQILFANQHELRSIPDSVAARLAGHLGQPGRADELAQYFRKSRLDVTSPRESWDRELTLAGVEWTAAEKHAYAIVADGLDGSSLDPSCI